MGMRNIVTTVLLQEKIWKMDLNQVEGLADKVTHYLLQIEKDGIAKALNEVM